jgi:purine-cytosine permease-like protein
VYLRSLTGVTSSRYAVSIIAILNLIAIVGFTLICVVIAGQTLSAVSDGKMTVTVGIVLSSLLGMFVSFCGYRVLHLFNTYSWIVTTISIIIAVGLGGKHLSNPVATEPATPDLIFDFGCLVAGFMLPFAGIMSDFAVYYSPDAPS